MKNNKDNKSSLNENAVAFSIKNMTRVALHVKNNLLSSLGPHKGQWIAHHDMHINPQETLTSHFLENETHQLMVYELKNAKTFLYMIHDTDITADSTVLLFADHYKIS